MTLKLRVPETDVGARSDTKQDIDKLWAQLTDEQQAEVVELLACLISDYATTRLKIPATLTSEDTTSTTTPIAVKDHPAE
jgi:hypothetical protein